MNIQNETDFINATSIQRRHFLKTHNITQAALAGVHKRTEASISYAISGHEKFQKLLERIAKYVFARISLNNNSQIDKA